MVKVSSALLLMIIFTACDQAKRPAWIAPGLYETTIKTTQTRLDIDHDYSAIFAVIDAGGDASEMQPKPILIPKEPLITETTTLHCFPSYMLVAYSAASLISYSHIAGCTLDDRIVASGFNNIQLSCSHGLSYDYAFEVNKEHDSFSLSYGGKADPGDGSHIETESVKAVYG